MRRKNNSSTRCTLMSKESEQAFTPEDFQMRFDAAAQAAQREYCNIFAFWRGCRLKSCRRSRACGGDPQLCLKRGFTQVPDELCDALSRASSRPRPPTPTGRPN